MVQVRKLSQADRAVSVINLLTHTKGPFAGQTFNLRPWQVKVIRKLFSTRPDGRRQYRTCLFMLPRKNGKALELNTPIPTPYGWVPIGDLQPGDAVFDERGRACNVVAVGPIQHGRPCHRVTFGDGSHIVADAEHEWLADHRDWSAGPRIVTTVGMKASCRIVVAAALDLPSTALPIPPYTLGAWLGDGRCDGASLSSEDEEVYTAIAAEGVPIKRSRWEARLGGDRSQAARGVSVQARLRSMGLLEAKRIPTVYQRSGTEQRMALLRGLMDTDGYCSKAGQCEITTIYPDLATDIVELVRGLGMKASCTVGRAMMDGRDCGAKYRVQFWAFADIAIFTIGRKVERQKTRPLTPTRTSRHYVQSVEPVDSRPVRCIQVDSPSRLFLAGESMIPTHNSEMAAALAIYFLMFDSEIGAEVYSAASDRDQAALVFNVAAQMIRNDPELSAECEIIDSQKRIVHRKSGSFYRAISAEAYSKHGFNASVVIYDELHAAPNRELWDVLATSQGARAQPMMIAITTAGYDRHSILWELYDHAKKVLENPSLDPTFLPILFEAPKDADWTDEKVWKKANPALGDFRSLEEMRIAAARAKEIPAQENTFRRLYLNQWCMVAGTLVLMANGARRAVETLRSGERVQAFDEITGGLRSAAIVTAGPNGVQPVFKISTARGRSVTVTGNHRCWTKRGWVRADALAESDHISVAHSWSTDRGGRRLNSDTAYLLGLMTGDGSCHGSPRLTTVDAELVAASNAIMEPHGCMFAQGADGVHWHVRHLTPSLRSTWLKRTLKKYDLYGVTSHSKRVPQAVFASGPLAWAAYLSGYLDSDGHVATDRVVWVSVSDDLLRDCQDLLAALGIQSSVSPATSTQRARLEVRHASSLKMLAESLVPRHDKKSIALTWFNANRKGDPFETTWWDRVVSVQQLPPVETYGLEVERYHTHVTNGLITHNTEQAERWIDMAAWDACAGPTDWRQLRDAMLGKPCCGGLDLSSRTDLTAKVLFFDDNTVVPFFWVPEEGAAKRSKTDRVPYEQWIREGLITPTPGNVVDQGFIREDINRMAKDYKLRELAFDPWNATKLAVELDQDGVKIVEMRQGFRSLSEPTKHLGALVTGRTLKHGGHPVLRWMASNMVVRQDPNGNLSPDKSKVTERIDGIVALIMAIGAALANRTKDPEYQMYIYGGR